MILNLTPVVDEDKEVTDTCVPDKAALEEWVEIVVDVCLEIEAEFVKDRVNRFVGLVFDDEAEE